MLLKSIKKINPVAAALHAAGLGTSIASVVGSYHYMVVESSSELMAGAFAVGLAAAIFGGWEFVFNSKSKQRRVTASAIALLAACVSGQTVFEYNHHRAVTEAQAKVDAETSKTDSKQSAANELLKSQLAELKASNDALRAQNEADLKAIASSKKGADWQAAQIRKEVDKRNQQISTNNNKAGELTAKLNDASKPSADGNKDVVVPVTPMQVVRAYLFEVLTVLSLLFARWISDEKQAEDNRLAQPLLTAIAQAREALEAIETRTLDAEIRAGDAAARIDAVIDQAIADLKTSADIATSQSAEQLAAIQTKYTAVLDEINQLGDVTTNSISLVKDHALTAGVESIQQIDAARAALDNHAQSVITALKAQSADCHQVAASDLSRLLDASNRAEALAETLANVDKKITEGRELSTEILALLELSEQTKTEYKNCFIEAEQIKNQICEATAVAAAESNNLQKILQNVIASTAAANDVMAAIAETRQSALATRQLPANAVANEPANGGQIEEKSKLGKDDIISLIKNRQIPTANGKKITIEKIVEVTGVGKDLAMSAREAAYNAGHLTRTPAGKGWTYTYPICLTDEHDLTPTSNNSLHVTKTTPDHNVINLFREV